MLFFGFVGFFFAGKGAEVETADLAIGTIIGIIIGALVGFLFNLISKRKKKAVE